MSKKKLKFAIDIDETITAAPECFATIINALKDAGHEIHIITFRSSEYYLEQTREELKGYGIKYDYLHLTGEKDKVCQEYGIDIALDDAADFHYPEFAKFWIGFALCKQKTRNKSGQNWFAAKGRGHSEKEKED